MSLNSVLLIIWQALTAGHVLRSHILYIYAFQTTGHALHLSVARPYRQGTVAKPIGVAMETLLFTACAQVKC